MTLQIQKNACFWFDFLLVTNVIGVHKKRRVCVLVFGADNCVKR